MIGRTTFEPGNQAFQAHLEISVRAVSQEGGCDGLATVAAERLKAVAQYGVRSVRCEHREGVLLLQGIVASYYHKQLVQEAVRGLEGVTKILNQVKVVPRDAEPMVSGSPTGCSNV
jgi:hypothetical protein